MSKDLQNTAKGGDTVGNEVWMCDMPDDADNYLLALIVLDDITNELRTTLTINAALRQNRERWGDRRIWLAGSYDNLPDCTGLSPYSTLDPIDPHWRSPFVGRTIPDAISFIREAIQPPKPLNKRFCAVVTQNALQRKEVLISKSLEDESDSDSDTEDESELAQPPPTQQPGPRARLLALSKGNPRPVEPEVSRKQVLQQLGDDYEGIRVIPTPANELALFQGGFERHKWKDAYIAWRQNQQMI